MDPIAETRLGSEVADLMPIRRRRPSRSPVSLGVLAALLWRAGRPFVPLALLAVVFALSLGVIQVEERVTPPLGAGLPSVSSAGPEEHRATSREVRVLAPDQTTCRRVRSAPGQSGPVRTRAT